MVKTTHSNNQEVPTYNAWYSQTLEQVEESKDGSLNAVQQREGVQREYESKYCTNSLKALC